jgi:hypothetical protein
MVALIDDRRDGVLLPTQPRDSHESLQPGAEQEQRGRFGGIFSEAAAGHAP